MDTAEDAAVSRYLLTVPGKRGAAAEIDGLGDHRAEFEGTLSEGTTGLTAGLHSYVRHEADRALLTDMHRSYVGAARAAYESGEYQAVVGKRLDATSGHWAVLVDGMA